MTTGEKPRVLLHAYVTEKAMDEMERQNKLEFVVERRATRGDVKRAVEDLYKAKVAKVTIKVGRPGKIATVRFTKDYSSEDIGSRAGVF
ncbi:MAG: 50S ribosomal protein L23 [Euryarchaeota archaeon]|nr:50S ribosomal protein L23 [Euryarchaeota archaeon]MDE1835737.1 50S ribosomal protein L23 [Euryarchaeota archaeon]MDE1880838.1 50S ribosomal protein L23 [Euryarchaeota archaeon]MDE2043928.1 50S ribosomal protein L23 [Thermoplasmata archaeon]